MDKNRDFASFLKTMLTIAEHVYRQEADKATAVIYFDELRAFPLPIIEKALHAHVQDAERGQWFPTVTDIIAHAQRLEREASEGARQVARDRWLPPPDDVDTNPDNWLPADPVEASLAVWRSVIASLGYRMRGEDAPEFLNHELAAKQLHDVGAFEHGLPVGWRRMFRHNPGSTPLSDWAGRYAQGFREAYCRHYGVMLQDSQWR